MNNDIDIDVEENDATGRLDAKAGLKETWDNNPLMKIAAIVLGGAILLGAYFTFLGGDGGENIADASRISADSVDVSAVPGQENLDPVYRQAVEEKNEQGAQMAEQMGGTFLPTPIGSAADQGLSAIDAPERPQEDALSEWRRAQEAKRMGSEETPEDLEADMGAQADLVPIVEPVRPQPQVQHNPEAADALAEQMRVIIGAQAPQESSIMTVTEAETAYVAMKREQQEREAEAENAGAGGSGDSFGPDDEAVDEDAKVIVPAGTVTYAQLLTELNSDIKGPALAHVLSGPFAGGRALGSFTLQDEYLVIKFERVVKDGQSYAIEAIALDQDTTLAGMQSDVDRHYFSRVILPAAAKFVEGMAGAYAETQTSTTSNGDTLVQDSPELSTEEEVATGVEEAASKVSEILDENADKPVTVVVKKGTTMGILFVEPVTDKDKE